MVKPPRQPLVRTVFEINDRIFVAVKLLAVKCISRSMHCRRIGDLSLLVYLFAVKFAEYRSRCRAVETVAVIEYSKFHMGQTQNILG